MGRKHRTHQRKMRRLDTRNWVNAIKLGDGVVVPLNRQNSTRQSVRAWRTQCVHLAVRTARTVWWCH